ncbi:MAG: addiction module antitoxin [Gammaproteobacteria bacterium]|nr:addiction module antitoxin [Gammaproteobacteria bacterium]
MQKKLTITIDEKVYFALYAVVGKRHISQFLENLARPHVLLAELEESYQAMANDVEREREADEWIDVIGDFSDEDEAR